MTIQEFSDTFDTLLNSYSNKRAFGDQGAIQDISLDEYEKSVFLTQAQDQIVLSLYTGRSQTGLSFENTEELRRSLDSLVKQKIYKIDEKVEQQGLSEKSVFFKLPEDLMFITLEQVKYEDANLYCYDGRWANVYPITQDEYAKVINNPFRGPTKYKVIRLDPGNGIVELISKYEIGSYLIRYLARPKPIVLVDLTDTSINGVSEKTECELNILLHSAILERAVQLAMQSKLINKSNV